MITLRGGGPKFSKYWGGGKGGNLSSPNIGGGVRGGT